MSFSSEWNGNAFSLFIILFLSIASPDDRYFPSTPFLQYPAPPFIRFIIEASIKAEYFQTGVEKQRLIFRTDNHASHKQWGKFSLTTCGAVPLGQLASICVSHRSVCFFFFCLKRVYNSVFYRKSYKSARISLIAHLRDSIGGYLTIQEPGT